MTTSSIEGELESVSAVQSASGGHQILAEGDLYETVDSQEVSIGDCRRLLASHRRLGSSPEAGKGHLARPSSESGSRATIERASVAKSPGCAESQRVGFGRTRPKGEEPAGRSQSRAEARGRSVKPQHAKVESEQRQLSRSRLRSSR